MLLLVSLQRGNLSAISFRQKTLKLRQRGSVRQCWSLLVGTLQDPNAMGFFVHLLLSKVTLLNEEIFAE